MKALVFSLSVGFLAVACNSQPQEKSKETSSQKNEVSQRAERKPYTEFYPTGELKLNGFKEGDLRVGVWSSWFKTGEQKSEAYYINGKKNGEYRIWHKNGQVQVLGYYDMGAPSGTWTSFDSTGTQIATKNYDAPATE